jgi:hypothetical protein
MQDIRQLHCQIKEEAHTEHGPPNRSQRETYAGTLRGQECGLYEDIARKHKAAVAEELCGISTAQGFTVSNCILNSVKICRAFFE